MASVVARPRKDGTTVFQVRWREGGGRHGEIQTERFETEEDAESFKGLVNAHGQHWPYGWVRGQGFVEPGTDPNDVPLLDWAYRYVKRLTGIDARTREDYEREVRIHLSLIRHTTLSGHEVPATICNLTQDDVQDWVRLEEEGERSPKDETKWRRRPANPKSIRNRHGLLFCIVQAAVESEPQLRTKNCCQNTRLPRIDDETEEEMCFLEQNEYQRIRIEITDPNAQDLADWLVGTGMRWGEATALRVRDFNLDGPKATVSIHRAWKKAKKGSPKAFYIGPPKTRKARRTLVLSPSQASTARRLIAGLPPQAFVFRTAWGNPWHHANFYNRKWKPAVDAAIAKGLPKRPRIHDLRHTHASWLIAARVPLPAIQARLGHKSITTTVDRYGHLVQALEDEISAAVEEAMGAAAPGLRPLSLVG